MNKTITPINKDSRLENLLALKKAINDDSLKDYPIPNEEWGGAYVIITSHKENVLKSTNDNDVFVLTKNSKILSKLFYYVKENIMIERDFYLYGFMALLANDFMKEFGDLDDYGALLNYVASGIEFYYRSKHENLFQIMRFFLSSNISEEDIKHVL